MSTTILTTDTTHDVTRAQLENVLHALRHALPATTPLIGAAEDGRFYVCHVNGSSNSADRPGMYCGTNPSGTAHW
jgi:hypothetical protein